MGHAFGVEKMLTLFKRYNIELIGERFQADLTFEGPKLFRLFLKPNHLEFEVCFCLDLVYKFISFLFLLFVNVKRDVTIFVRFLVPLHRTEH